MNNPFCSHVSARAAFDIKKEVRDTRSIIPVQTYNMEEAGAFLFTLQYEVQKVEIKGKK